MCQIGLRAVGQVAELTLQRCLTDELLSRSGCAWSSADLYRWGPRVMEALSAVLSPERDGGVVSTSVTLNHSMDGWRVPSRP